MISERLNALDTKEDIRFDLWDIGLKMNHDNYYLGVGIGQAKYLSAQYFTESTNFYLRFRYNDRQEVSGLQLHNMYLQFFTEYSIVGLLLYIIFLYGSAKFWWKRFRESPENTIPFVMLSIIAFTAVYDFFGTNLLNPSWWFLLMVISRYYWSPKMPVNGVSKSSFGENGKIKEEEYKPQMN